MEKNNPFIFKFPVNFLNSYSFLTLFHKKAEIFTVTLIFLLFHPQNQAIFNPFLALRPFFRGQILSLPSIFGIPTPQLSALPHSFPYPFDTHSKNWTHPVQKSKLKWQLLLTLSAQIIFRSRLLTLKSPGLCCAVNAEGYTWSLYIMHAAKCSKYAAFKKWSKAVRMWNRFLNACLGSWDGLMKLEFITIFISLHHWNDFLECR